MSRDQINKLLEDITKDPSEWQRDQTAFLGRYELTPEERDALISGDDAKMRAVGVDERLNKPRTKR
jgi:hypothetical protein